MVSLGWCVLLILACYRELSHVMKLKIKPLVWLSFSFLSSVFHEFIFSSLILIPFLYILITFWFWVQSWVLLAGKANPQQFFFFFFFISRLRVLAEIAAVNHRPAVIDGVLKEILDRFHCQSLWSPAASWQLPSHQSWSSFQLKTT